MKQLRLFERPQFDLLAKIVKEAKAGVKVVHHWNGKPWR